MINQHSQELLDLTFNNLTLGFIDEAAYEQVIALIDAYKLDDACLLLLKSIDKSK